MNIILASASPRRLALLRELGVEPDVQPSDIDETPHPGETAEALVERLAIEKAQALSPRSDELVIAADTVVVVDGLILGKPTDDDEARRHLTRLSGAQHSVCTGVAVRRGPMLESAVETTLVTMAPLSIADINWYVATGEPADKAGAYALQGIAGAFVEEIHGSFDNVIGLPRNLLLQLCRRLDVDLLQTG